MLALRRKVVVKKGGRIELDAPELHEGATAEVIVLLEPDSPLPTLHSLLGKAKGNFSSAKEAEDFIRKERAAWES
ncbi:hypothetical protein [Meiothermus taiwanensis]|jgi:hypothetical protein|uniref:hypothetical protein n=1 Tax=Meiothermus taiwanensis TaxID=172827 RepID=UPI0009DC0D55|nr:hypothetical protein [Meiothermus taiwanensis]